MNEDDYNGPEPDINNELAPQYRKPVPVRSVRSGEPQEQDLRRELRTYLDTLVITGDNIGDIRRRLFMPWDSPWNGWVRDETAERETSSAGAARSGEIGWQPIETAPKDGTEILAHVLHNETRVIWWDGQEWRVPGLCVIYPTHWMPLPDPPVGEIAPRER